MDRKNPATLLELTIQTLLKNELLLIQHLEEMPKILYIPLFSAAFTGGHRKTLAAIVKVWPFFCLHIGRLRLQVPYHEVLRIMINSLQILPVQNSTSRSSKLRILDLRHDTLCEITCPELITGSSGCLYSCSSCQHTVFRANAKDDVGNSASFETQPSRKAMELLVDLSLNSTLRERRFISLILRKVEQSVGLLHLCCRDLQINTLSECKSTLKLFTLECIDNLRVCQASLNEVTILLQKMKQLDKLILSRITLRSLESKVFTAFLKHLGKMCSLKEFCLSNFSLRNHLENLLRALPPDLKCLYLPFCELSHTDFTFLPECPQANHLRMLNLSHISLYWEDCENIRILLEKLSGTLQCLELNHCLLTDSTMSLLLPSLSHCSQLKEFIFICNPISMFMLKRIIQQLTPLTKLKYVIYPIPSHCYDGWYFYGHLNLQKLADVKAQVNSMVKAAHREDMDWITHSL
uniref:melanoma antigen preferentially expressed in tumors-like n=1 Tax=Jaculus jaculus TaxID=51337 RepID=UPI0003332501|nr:melanoma antigen preferentially expressed in tumors-like [Jaculus jaculus]